LYTEAARPHPSEYHANYTRCVLEVDFAHKIGCHGNVPSEIEKITSDRSSMDKVLLILQIS